MYADVPRCRCACVDSYRALVLRPSWSKAYYRCAEAWSRLGRLSEALAINITGLAQCEGSSELQIQSVELKAALR